MLLHTSLWLQWLLCLNVALNWLIIFHIILIWHHLTIFCFPTWKNIWLGSSIRPRWGYICSWWLFQGWELRYHRNPSAATPMEEVYGLQGRLCWKINHIWSIWPLHELFSLPSYKELPNKMSIVEHVIWITWKGRSKRGLFWIYALQLIIIIITGFYIAIFQLRSKVLHSV